MSNKIIFGLTLFSVVQNRSSKYILHKKDYDAYVEELFSEPRLDLKSEIFFNLSLPQLDAMTKKGCDYKHLLIYSHGLPDKYKEYIAHAEKEFSFLYAKCVSDYKSFNIKNEVAKSVNPGGVFSIFGLDDDDLLSIDYLQKLKNYIKKEFVGFNIVMSKGFSGFYNGELSNCREVRFPFINIGQARICERRDDGQVFIPDKGSHMKTDEKCPTVIDSRTPVFFWLRHFAQDTFSSSESEAAFLKIKKDLDNYPEPSEKILKNFPSLRSVLKDEAIVVAESACDISLDEYKEKRVVFDKLEERSLTGKVVLKYSLTNFSGSSRRQAIAIFELSRKLSETELEVSGLQLSRVGYYRYFNTGSERSSGSFSIELPDSVFLVALDAMKWGEEDILINKIDVLQ
ncbi:glycosyltransferase [Pistricoccus aurantiacus]|uniref:glycosyltransferase n=1 Tax=Pistricoccus aurantiacus TaxID=1883414 RepID=UPI003638532A